jgi:hypothetical protein
MPITAPAGRVLRWVFARADQTCCVELALDDDAIAYELRWARNDAPRTVVLEKFRHVSRAFRRQAQLAVALADDGWKLACYAPVIIHEGDEKACSLPCGPC